MTDVYISPEPDDDGWCTVRCAYDSGVVGIIRDAASRIYNPQTKIWRVAEFCVDAVIDQLTGDGHHVVRAAEPPPPKPRHPDGLSTLDVFFTLPPDGFNENEAAQLILNSLAEHHRHRVFRAMARILYPDMYTRAQRR